MTIDMDRLRHAVGGIDPVGQPQPTKPKPQVAGPDGPKFQEVLESIEKTKAPEVTVSSHAMQRLSQRGITLDQADMAKISSALDKAEEKGAKESLFVLRDMALVVSVENRTVITALQGESAKENVFTNIDSAVLL